ncbi:hypothetical protein ACGFR6_27880 [Streptomyces sp. NPDC048567]|uniref:hypothetical protein n=1 Tax=Streptomyces sp. NPDC048567 TaxID=3365570 RepID=UPI003713910E
MWQTEGPWETEEFGGSHQGRPGAMLPDGSDPQPVIFDLGSGTHMHETSDWWVYDGHTRNAPRAAVLRGACSCGWRGTTLHPIDWQEVAAEGPEWYDTSGPQSDWKQHIADVEARTVPVPEDVTALLAQLRKRLEVLADDAPLAALRVVAALEHAAAEVGEVAAYVAQADDQSWDTIAVGLGITESEARTRLQRHARRY